MDDDIKFPPVWGSSTPMDYKGPGDPVEEGLETLVPPGQIVELRVLGARNSGGKELRLSGFFDDPVALRDAVREQEWASARSICVTLNPLRPDTGHVIDNRVGPARKGACTSDADVATIRTIPLDFDPVRPKDANSTDAEHEAALDRARAAIRWLHEMGVYASLADSGNGAHVHIHVHLPAERDTARLIERVMNAVSFGFDDEQVALDPCTGNPSRVAKLPGTMCRKGEDLPDRPHRRSEMLATALRGFVTPRQALEEVASFGLEEA